MTDIKNVIKELEAIGIHDVKEVVYNPSYEQLLMWRKTITNQ